MANELRRVQNFLGGLIEDNPLTSGATTLTSGGLAAITGGIGSTDYMAITLDPDGLGGAPEIVWITALTNGAASCTIARGKEGTTAREHLRDVPWVHAMTTTDIGYVDYTPSFTQSGALTTSSLVARVSITNKQVHAWGKAVFSNAGTTNNAVLMTLPVPLHASYVDAILGTGVVADTGTLWMPSLVIRNSSTLAGWTKTNADIENYIGVTALYGFAVASGDYVSWNIRYEAA